MSQLKFIWGLKIKNRDLNEREKKSQMLRCKTKQINTLLAMWLMRQLNMEARHHDKSIYVQNFKVPFPLAMDCH